MRKLFQNFGIILLALVICLGLPVTYRAAENNVNANVANTAFFNHPDIYYAAESGMTTSEPYAYNEDTGYEIYIDDWADLLTPEEEDELMNIMGAITAYGNAGFISIDSNPEDSVETYAQNYGYAHFGNNSYTLFVIDMDYRKVCIYSDGEIYNTITTAYANTITDNMYSYASDGAYFDCASEAFLQIATLLDGGSIAQPMKYISNALLSVVLALLINYFIVMFVSRSVKASETELLRGINKKVTIIEPTKTFLHQTKVYSPQQRSSGSRSGGGGGVKIAEKTQNSFVPFLLQK